MSDIAGLSVGSHVTSVQVVEHLDPQVEGDRSAEAVELVLEGGRSVLLSAGTDWTLQVAPGSWPDLPTWCWPVSEWVFTPMDEIGDRGADRVLNISAVENDLKELKGAIISFATGQLIVESGAAITCEFRPTATAAG